MNKLLFLFIGIILILVLVVLFVLPKKQETLPPQPVEQFQPSGIASPTPAPTSQALSVISSIPSMNAQDVPPNITLRITFNKEFSIDSAQVNITPPIPIRTREVSNVLFIEPTIDLLPNTSYDVEILLSGMVSPYILSFKTAAQNPTGTAPDAESIREQDEISRQLKPSVYLANKLPYSTAQFDANWSTRPSPKTLYFIIILKDADKTSAKNAFIDWLHSLQLTDAQIQGLDIEYQ